MCNDAKKAHPHAENMIEYGKDARATDKPWELWQRKYDWKEGWKNILGHPDWDEEVEYRRKPKEPELIQGYTAEQWQFIIDGNFLCEFSSNGSHFLIGYLKRVQAGPLPFKCTVDGAYKFCRPLRIKGVKQPWFGGERPVKGDTLLAVNFRSGEWKFGFADTFNFRHSVGDPIIAFIEL